MSDYNVDYDNDDEDFISRTQIKREAEAAQDLGEKLIGLRQSQLDEMALPERLYDAIMEAKRLTSNGAIRRQKQFIGKLMRQVELEPIEAKFAEWERAHRSQAAKLHQFEHWRDRLLADDKAIGELLQTYPHADIQHLRTLIRNANKEKLANKPPKSSRELFKVLRDLMS